MDNPQPIPESCAVDLESGVLAPQYPPASHGIADPWAESAYPPPTTKQSNYDEINIADGLNSLFSVYTGRATEEDQKMAGGWMSVADDMLVMSYPFSIVVAIFLGRPYQDLLPNSQSASAFYLAQFYQLSVSQNNTLVPLPSTLSDPSTSSPVPAVWVSALWSVSLVLSLTCGLFATLQKQWARRYLHITQTAHNPRARVRVREFMSQGVEKLHLPWVVEALPALFHTSVFLFFAGLAIYLFNINHPVFWVVIAPIAICAGIYLCITLLPLFRRDSPYSTPFSPLIRSCTMAVSWLTLALLYHSTKRLKLIDFGTRLHILDLVRLFRRRMVGGMTKEVEDLVHSHSLDLDTPAMKWAFNTLNNDHDLERFLVGIPGFYGSEEVTKNAQILEDLNSTNLPVAIVSFMDRSLSSDLVAERTKRTRVATCLKAIDANPLLLQCTFRQTLHFPQSSVFGCVDFVRLALAKSQSADADPWTKHFARCIIAVTVGRLQHHDDRWSDIVQRHLDSESSLLRWEEYRHQGNSVQLRNLVHFARGLMALFLGGSRQLELGGIWHNTLQEVCKFTATHVAPELQHEFCTLWNELVNVRKDQQAPQIARLNAELILSIIRTVYVPLHEGTKSALATLPPSTSDGDAPVDFQYDLCVVHSHHRRSSETDPTPVTIQPCVGRKDTAFRGKEEETQATESSKASSSGRGEQSGEVSRVARKSPENRQASGSPTIIPTRRGQLRETVGRARTPSPGAVDSGISIKDL